MSESLKFRTADQVCLEEKLDKKNDTELGTRNRNRGESVAVYPSSTDCERVTSKYDLNALFGKPRNLGK